MSLWGPPKTAQPLLFSTKRPFSTGEKLVSYQQFPAT